MNSLTILLWFFLVLCVCGQLEPDYFHLRKLVVDNFESSVVEAGVDIEHVGDGFGIFAKREIKKGEILFQFPVEACITKLDLLTQYPEFERIDRELEEGLMAYYVASLYFKQSKEVVNENPFLYALPSKDRCINGNTLAADIEKSFDSSFYSVWDDYFARDALKFRYINYTLGSRASLREDEYLWGICVIRSRSFSPDIEKYGNYNHLPIVDLLNHSHEKENVGYRVQKENWVFYALTDIGEHEELLIEYGCKPKMEMLYLYGFVPEATPERCDFVMLNRDSLQIRGNKVHWNGSGDNVPDDMDLRLDKELRKLKERRQTAGLRVARQVSALQNMTISYLQLGLRLTAKRDEL